MQKKTETEIAVKLILEYNQLDQEGSGSKILTPDQMLCRLRIF